MSTITIGQYRRAIRRAGRAEGWHVPAHVTKDMALTASRWGMTVPEVETAVRATARTERGYGGRPMAWRDALRFIVGAVRSWLRLRAAR